MVVQLEGVPAGLETSDETAVDSLEPDSMDVADDVISPEPDHTEESSAADAEDVSLCKPNFRVDAQQPEELMMTPEEADSLLSSR